MDLVGRKRKRKGAMNLILSKETLAGLDGGHIERIGGKKANSEMI